jgi:hypothetical protein
MSHRVKRTRLVLSTLLLSTLLLAPGPVTATPRTPRALAGFVGEALSSVAPTSVLAPLQELLSLFGTGPGRAIRPGARSAPGLHALHGGAGCGIDPNGVYHCT